MNILQKIITAISSIFLFIGGIISPEAIAPSLESNPLNSLSIQSMRNRTYTGGDIAIEETLSPAPTYSRYIASYESGGLKIYALLYVPKGNKPAGGWPAIIFNHGYIIPEKYTPDGNYIAYTDALAKAGYIVFKPDYRGHGKSEGAPTSAYFSPDYTIDNLNAIESLKRYKDINPDKIGVWGHSMGGNITLRNLVINRADIKAAVIWGGVVGSYNDILFNWQNRVSYKPNAEDLLLRNKNREMLIGIYGTPSDNPDFWNSIDPTFYLSDITTPLQINVGLADNQVPPDFSSMLYNKMKALGKVVDYNAYPGANHDINQSFTNAMNATINFYDSYLK